MKNLVVEWSYSSIVDVFNVECNIFRYYFVLKSIKKYMQSERKIQPRDSQNTYFKGVLQVFYLTWIHFSDFI